MTEKWEKPIIEHSKLTKFNYIVQYPENLKIGKNFDIGSFTYINCKFGVEIQDYVQIGSHCSIYSHSTIDQKKGTVLLKKIVELAHILLLCQMLRLEKIQL